jgi:hypothetical protein
VVNQPEVLDAAFRTDTSVLGRIAAIAAYRLSKPELWNGQEGSGAAVTRRGPKIVVT